VQNDSSGIWRPDVFAIVVAVVLVTRPRRTVPLSIAMEHRPSAGSAARSLALRAIPSRFICNWTGYEPRIGDSQAEMMRLMAVTTVLVLSTAPAAAFAPIGAIMRPSLSMRLLGGGQSGGSAPRSTAPLSMMASGASLKLFGNQGTRSPLCTSAPRSHCRMQQLETL
jgi:hypothetical protein